MTSLSLPFSPTPLRLINVATELVRADLRRHWGRLGRGSRRLRFLGEASTAALDRLAERASPEILLEVEADGAVRGVFEAYAMAPGHAEIALSVEDGYQGQGLGRSLFEEGLLELARRGYVTADLLCLRENGAVQHLVRAAGGRIRFEEGCAVMEIDLDRVLQAIPPEASETRLPA